MQSIADALKNHLFDASDAADLVTFESNDMKNIIMNILHLGMPAVVEEILRKYTEAEESTLETERKEKTDE